MTKCPLSIDKENNPSNNALNEISSEITCQYKYTCKDNHKCVMNQNKKPNIKQPI